MQLNCINLNTRSIMDRLEQRFKINDHRLLHCRVNRVIACYPNVGLALERLRLAVKAGAGEEVEEKCTKVVIERTMADIAKDSHRRAVLIIAQQLVS